MGTTEAQRSRPWSCWSYCSLCAAGWECEECPSGHYKKKSNVIGLWSVFTGGYIKGRFTQKDLEQKAIRYIIPADMEVTADSFEFRVTDPAGNTMLPEV